MEEEKSMRVNRFCVMSAAVLLSISVSTAYAAIEGGKEDSDQKKVTSLAPADQEMHQKLKESAEEAKEIVVARANGQPISMFQLVGMMNRVAPQYVQSPQEITDEISEQVKRKALDQLIFEELALQAADRQQIAIPAENVDKVVSRIKAEFPSEEVFQKDYLERIGLSEEALRGKIERGQKLQLVTAREIYGKVEVEEKKIKEEYEKMKAAGTLHQPEHIIVKDVFLMQGENEKITKKRAEKLLAEIRKNGGDIGKLILDGTFIVRQLPLDKERNPAVYDAVQKMSVDEMSQVIKDKDSYHIIKVVKKEPARDSSFEEARAFVENRLRVPAQEERKATWEKELRHRARIEILLDQVEDELKNKADGSPATGGQG
jgi:parvulin-like peptidyl-prolyl isomerase